MTGSRRAFLMATGTIAAGFGTCPGTTAGGTTSRITVGEGIPALADVTAAFNREYPDLEVGTVETEGFERFVRGEVDVQQAPRPMTAAERERARENGVEVGVRELPLEGVAALGRSEGWCRCLSGREREKLIEEGRVETWSEITSTVPDDLDSSASPDEEASVLVRGTRSHQYAIGHGGLGDYTVSPSAFEPVGADHERLTTAVRIGFAYVDRDATNRDAIAALLERQDAAAVDVDHVPTVAN